jgi:hypothetical protein
VKAVRSLFLVKVTPEKADTLETAFRELRAALLENRGMPKDVRHRVHAAEGEGKNLKAVFQGVLKYREREIRGVLLPSQVEIVEDFSPCTFPPETLTNPVRVGEADRGEYAQVEKGLAKVRRMGDREYREKRGEIVRKLRESLSKKIFADRLDGELDRIMKIVDGVRGMEEAELQLRKADIAREILPKDMAQDLSKRLDRFNRRVHGSRSKVAKYLLNLRIIPLLEDRLARMEGFKPGAPKDLTKVRGAASCRDGKCGKKYDD